MIVRPYFESLYGRKELLGLFRSYCKVWTCIYWGNTAHERYFLFPWREKLRMTPCGEMRAWGEVSGDKCLLEKQVLCLEYECLVTSLSPAEDFVGLRILGLLESAPCCCTHPASPAQCFSRAAQAPRDHEETEETGVSLWVTPCVTLFQNLYFILLIH